MLAQRAHTLLWINIEKYSDLQENLGNFAKFEFDFRGTMLVIVIAVIHILC